MYKDPDYKKRWYIKNRKELLVSIKKYKDAHKEETAENKKDYYLRNKELFAERDAKLRGLGWIKLYENAFDESAKISWHHVDDTHVVAIPWDLHKLYLKEQHKENLEYIINQIYE